MIRKILFLLSFCLILLTGWSNWGSFWHPTLQSEVSASLLPVSILTERFVEPQSPPQEMSVTPVQTIAATDDYAVATFAGGCFWCMEPPFDLLRGVITTTSGYIGGTVANPTYEQVSGGSTGHAESVQVTYDPERISYERLLQVYWHNVDPLDEGGQFCDRGNQYRTAIFYHSPAQEALALASKAQIEQKLGRTVATAIVPAGQFYAAEDYHQDYYKKQPVLYRFYRFRCGRDRRLEQLWGTPSRH